MLAFQSATINLSQHKQWESNMFYVINRTSGIIKNSYRKGERMIELYNWSVLKSEIWDKKISVSNQSINNSIIYPMPWTCDNSSLYIGTFTEKEANVKLLDINDNRKLDNSTQYYVMVYDDTVDGQIKFTKAKISNSTDFTETDGNWGPNTFPKYIDIGGENWPFMILNFNETNKTLNIFTRKYNIDVNNTPLLSLYASATNYDGSPVTGTINLTEVMGMNFSHKERGESFGPPPIVNRIVNVSNESCLNLTNGKAYIDMNVGNLTEGPYNLKAIINNTEIGLTEILSGNNMNFFVMGNKVGCKEGSIGG